MTSRANRHQDQATSPEAAIATVGDPARIQENEVDTDQDRMDREWNDRPASVPSADRQQQERRRRLDNVGIGAPLTAAFIGGFLVIENLAGADQPGEGDAVALGDDALALEGEGGDDPLSSSGAGGGDGAASGEAEGSGRAGDPDAAPLEDAGMQPGAAGAGPSSGLAMVEALASGAPMPEGTEGGGDATINFFDIDVGNGGIEAIDGSSNLDQEILVRNKEVGTNGDDVLIGTDGDDEISGGSGDDIIRGEGGRDILNGNEGDDQLFGGTGSDRLDGGAGNDRLEGGADSDLDLLRGGLGDDVIFIESHVDVALERDFGAYADDDDLVVIRDGYADDLPNGETSSTFVFADNLGEALPSGAEGYRQLVSNGIENVRLEGNADHDIFADGLSNALTGNRGDNVIHGGAGDDEISGGGGGDRLDGGQGDDEIRGGSGDDVIEGGLGEDRLFGDGGDDVFVVGLNDSAVDTVFDHSGANRLKLEGITNQTVEATVLDDDLYVTVDEKPVAKIEGYVGNEEALAGVDFGQGLRSVDSLLTDHQDIEGALDDIEDDGSDDLLLTHEHLIEPNVLGDPRADQRLDGSEGDDWLSGFDGKDTLYGHDGNDILEGGDGSDKLRGGAGDDRYLFSSGEDGIDVIRDSEGRNLAELKGFDRAKVEGTMFGDDLRVLADGDLIFSVEDFAQHPESFQGVQVGQKLIQSEDLLT